MNDSPKVSSTIIVALSGAAGPADGAGPMTAPEEVESAECRVQSGKAQARGWQRDCLPGQQRSGTHVR